MPTIVPFDREHLEAVVRLALRAWEPVFPSIEEAMGTEIFRAQVADWRASQSEAVEAACTDGEGEAFVALIAGEVAGFREALRQRMRRNIEREDAEDAPEAGDEAGFEIRQ